MFADQGQAQQNFLLSELKRVGTQQEQLKKAVSEAAAEATARGEAFEISPLKSFKMSDSELAQLKGLQLKDRLGSKMVPPAADVSVAAMPVPEAAAHHTTAAPAPAGNVVLCCVANNNT